MGLADDLATIDKRGAVERALDQFDGRDREALSMALLDPDIGPSALATKLAKYGVTLHHASIERWRRANGIG